MQLGVVGLIAFASIVIGALWRSWFLAVDRPMDASGRPLPHTAAALVPLLLLVALIGQSLAESRILVESGWVAAYRDRVGDEASPMGARAAAGRAPGVPVAQTSPPEVTR